MRICLLLVAMLSAACVNQRRDAPERYDPWADYQPTGRTYYDHDYVPPQQRSPDTLIRQARQSEAAGRDDRARVEYHSAFRRDRWHVAGNTGYQDLMLRNDLLTPLWQEYLDLWEANPDRGDAFWFHMRPMLTQRSGPAPLRKPLLAEAEQQQLQQILAQAAAQEPEQARQTISAALEQHDWIELHRAAIRLSPESAERYAERAEADPSDGDALALHALAVAARDQAAALRMLRDGFVLELPGYWLYHTLAELCADLGDAIEPESGEDRRQAAGWYRTAEALYEYCGRAKGPDAAGNATAVQGKLNVLLQAGLD